MATGTGECQLDVAQQIWAPAAFVPLPLYLPDTALESISKLQYAVMPSSINALMTFEETVPLHES